MNRDISRKIIDVWTLTTLTILTAFCTIQARIVTMHHLVALGGSVLQGCLNLRDSGRGIQWTVQA